MANNPNHGTLSAHKVKKPFQDITALKTAQINELKLQVQAAKKTLAITQAAYDSYAAKSALFDTLLSEATNRLTVLTNQDNLAVDLSQKTTSLHNTCERSVRTANDTYADTKDLLESVQEVVRATIDAATDIQLSAELIMKRKAANPLISSELVTEASQAASDANKAVSLIINTMTATFNALVTANQANNTAESAQLEISYLQGKVVDKNNNANAIQAQARQYYHAARSAEKEAQSAADVARQEMLKAKNELTSATANLANAEAALNAAEAAVGS